MAGQGIIAQTAEIAIAASATKTVLLVSMPNNIRGKLKRWKVSFDGISTVQEPVQVELVRATSGGTMTSPLAMVKVNPSNPETIQSVGATNATAEPSLGDILENVEVHPQQGYELVYPLGEERPIPGGNNATPRSSTINSHIGIRVISPVGANYNCRALIEFEE